MTLTLKRALLQALLPCDGVPMPESALVGAAQILVRPHAPTRDDVRAALREVEAAGYVSGRSDDLGETTWTLTDKGTHKARQL